MWCQWRKLYSFWRGRERKQFHKGYFTQALEERWMQTAQGWVVMRTRAAAPGRAAEPGGRAAPRAQLGPPSRRGLPSLLPPGAGPRTRSPNPPRAEWRAPGQAPRRSRSPEKRGGGQLAWRHFRFLLRVIGHVGSLQAREKKACLFSRLGSRTFFRVGS